MLGDHPVRLAITGPGRTRLAVGYLTVGVYSAGSASAAASAPA